MREDLIVSYRLICGFLNFRSASSFVLNANNLKGHEFKLKKESFRTTPRQDSFRTQYSSGGTCYQARLFGLVVLMSLKTNTIVSCQFKVLSVGIHFFLFPFLI